MTTGLGFGFGLGWRGGGHAVVGTSSAGGSSVFKRWMEGCKIIRLPHQHHFGSRACEYEEGDMVLEQIPTGTG